MWGYLVWLKLHTKGGLQLLKNGGHNWRILWKVNPRMSISVMPPQTRFSCSTNQFILKTNLRYHGYTSYYVLVILDEKCVIQDKAWFYASRYVNSQNIRLWSSENPERTITTPKNWCLDWSMSKKIGGSQEMSAKDSISSLMISSMPACDSSTPILAVQIL